jgi:hypothetical protein
VLNRIVIGLVAAGAAVSGAPGLADADPEPAPPPLNVNAFEPVTPLDYASPDGSTYAFNVADGITCVVSRATGGYGCGGPLPAAPNAANFVSGSQTGAPGFANADRPMYIGAGEAKPLPAGSRISFRNVTCGTDGVMTICQNNFDQGGFVISPAGSFIMEPSNPLLQHGGAHSPFAN